ncbi:hypothetical protein SNEBB_001730, partial [Seison nebaliae]
MLVFTNAASVTSPHTTTY